MAQVTIDIKEDGKVKGKMSRKRITLLNKVSLFSHRPLLKKQLLIEHAGSGFCSQNCFCFCSQTSEYCNSYKRINVLIAKAIIQ